MGGFSAAGISPFVGQEVLYFEYLKSQVTTVLQVGIVDCAPRPIPKELRRVIGRLPSSVGTPTISFLHNNRPRIQGLGLRWRNTRPRRFASSFQQILNAVQSYSEQVYVLNICPTSEPTASHSPGLSESIQLYNGFISDAVAAAPTFVHLIDVHGTVSKDPDRCLLPDGIHLSCDGHDEIFRALLSVDVGLTRQRGLK